MSLKIGDIVRYNGGKDKLWGHDPIFPKELLGDVDLKITRIDNNEAIVTNINKKHSIYYFELKNLVPAKIIKKII